ncbi:MAG TPA: SET domain-containing protein [Acidimicrobiia bacterium]|nr:SET domain-containing protein [Acidimicrobiia bacterium]
MHQSWLNPLAEVRSAGAKGMGCFARQDLPAGTTVAGFGGHVVERAEFDELDEELRTHALQIDDRLYMVSLPPFAPADYVNHSCEPNCGIVGSCLLVTRRDVSVGEELCFDYAMSDTNDYDEFVCECGTGCCRRLITGGDWKLPELQARYAGFFSSYITRRIAQTAPTE